MLINTKKNPTDIISIVALLCVSIAYHVRVNIILFNSHSLSQHHPQGCFSLSPFFSFLSIQTKTQFGGGKSKKDHLAACMGYIHKSVKLTLNVANGYFAHITQTNKCKFRKYLPCAVTVSYIQDTAINCCMQTLLSLR